ncbi:P-loop containing nucleoside triphosphate hydrolases superfamily protein [Striga hermonthica]|uniref:Kinesin-like protein KIN-10A n=1 Tax=Striga hermonthica TaxID=68872 RepID=A0A9N7MZ33_STRHE|nr:P-loop containing nucleoside triphosphate hydrolases superfamily protein [Striga hermonthica]
MAPKPSSKSNHSTPSRRPNTAHHQSRTPQSKHRLQFNSLPSEHPVEVVGRIRDHPNKPSANPTSALQINGDGKSVRVQTEIGYRDFSLDGVSYSEENDLEGFYHKFVESRVHGVKLGQKCTVMMYGPTGSGKSHTMFGCFKQPGIVYNSLKGILGEEENGQKLTFVQVTVLEIYNEDIYDLLSAGNGFSLGWSKNSYASKVKLEVMGKKAKNATFISGNEAGKILKEIQKVEKRRIVKSTLCNERSSRSHCVIIVDVPTTGGRLMLVDMAGSENIEQAGQIGPEAKMQTAKINQGNIALKRVVESIANGDSHVPFRDSKLTMLLQDSFEDVKSKILMILCTSPDPKELHKTIATLEYGAKAKCIVRGPHTPVKDRAAEDSSSAVSRIAVLDQFICKLQAENKIKEKEKNEVQKDLKRKEEEISQLRAKLVSGVGQVSEEEINLKVHEQTRLLKNELERKITECQNMANEVLEMERRKMEEKMSQQQREVEFLRQRLEDIEKEVLRQSSVEIDSGNFMKRLLEGCNEDSDMVKSMDLSKSIDMENPTNTVVFGCINSINEGMHGFLPNKACLTTVYEEDEYENENDDEVRKEVIEEKRMVVTPEASFSNDELENSDDATRSRQLRIQNIFTLCGNYRDISQQNSCTSNVDDCAPRVILDEISWLQTSKPKTVSVLEKLEVTDQNREDLVMDRKEEDRNPVDDDDDGVDVYVKWEVPKENPGKQITTLKVSKNSSLTDLRKLIEIHLSGEAFSFLVGDPSDSPVPKEKEGTIQTSQLPGCNKQLRGGYLASLRPVKSSQWRPTNRHPFSSLENKLVPTTTPKSQDTKKINDGSSIDMLSTTFITVQQ